MRKRMNVYITTGKRNLKYAYVAIKSLFINNQSSEIFLYVVSEDLAIEDMVYEKELADRYGHHIIILHFDEKVAGKYIQYTPGAHWPIGTMSSYWLFHDLLPEEVDRIIVIESDTVITGDLSDIYHMEFQDSYVICPGPEHKPENHRRFMREMGGECLTFVLSMYNVSRIRQDFTLQDILNTDEVIKKHTGNSQMEYTFGLLFKGKIKYVPGEISCVDENERYIEELGYDYIVDCEKTAKIVHFSSYKDYGKPWNPVFLVPGYTIWWDYAKDSPYYKEYFEAQWEIYDESRKKVKALEKYITTKNILSCMIAIMTLLQVFCWGIQGQWIEGIVFASGTLIASLLAAAGIRALLIQIQKKRR